MRFMNTDGVLVSGNTQSIAAKVAAVEFDNVCTGQVENNNFGTAGVVRHGATCTRATGDPDAARHPGPELTDDIRVPGTPSQPPRRGRGAEARVCQRLTGYGNPPEREVGRCLSSRRSCSSPAARRRRTPRRRSSADNDDGPRRAAPGAAPHTRPVVNVHAVPVVVRARDPDPGDPRDIGVSVALPDGHDLWLFGDTSVYTMSAGVWGGLRFIDGSTALEAPYASRSGTSRRRIPVRGRRAGSSRFPATSTWPTAAVGRASRATATPRSRRAGPTAPRSCPATRPRCSSPTRRCASSDRPATRTTRPRAGATRSTTGARSSSITGPST